MRFMSIFMLHKLKSFYVPTFYEDQFWNSEYKQGVFIRELSILTS